MFRAQLIVFIIAISFQLTYANDNRFSQRPELIEKFIRILIGPTSKEKTSILNLASGGNLSDEEEETFLDILTESKSRLLQNTSPDQSKDLFDNLYKDWFKKRQTFLKVVAINFNKNPSRVDNAYATLVPSAKKLFKFVKSPIQPTRNSSLKKVSEIQLAINKLNPQSNLKQPVSTNLTHLNCQKHIQRYEEVKNFNKNFRFSKFNSIHRYDRTPRDGALLKEFAQILNERRFYAGLSSLKLNMELIRASNQHSKEMGEQGYFAHNAPENKGDDKFRTPLNRSNMFSFEGSYRCENIYMGSSNPSSAFRAWWVSDGHRFGMFSRNKSSGGYRVDSLGVAHVKKYWTMMTGKSFEKQVFFPDQVFDAL